ncbi:MAG TPA: hypothetical protein ENK75_07520 [Saprospiraceae bacterium]|nr:hypothetical protein [Saprospiraceae bacterium]
MVYTLRCILDTEEDVIRDIILKESLSLYDLHLAIVKFFHLPPGEMASFYRTNDDWEQGEEIPLIDMNDGGPSHEMKNHSLSSIFNKEQDKLLYIYDFFKMWTFFISLNKVKDNTMPQEVSLGFSLGILPEKAPAKNFISDNTFTDDFDDPFSTEFDDSIDNDEDFDNYY